MEKIDAKKMNTNVTNVTNVTNETKERESHHFKTLT